MNGAWYISYIVGAIFVMLRTNAKLAFWVLLIVPVIAVVAQMFQMKLVTLNHKIREVNSQITSNFNEGITGANMATRAMWERADIILVIKDGKIIEQGSHKELIAKRGEYYNLYTKQYQEERISQAMQAAFDG